MLLVDDEVLVRQGLRSLLEKESFVQNVYEAGDADACYEALSTYHIDIVLLDIRLRSASGVEILGRIQERDPRPKVVAVTGLEGVELIVELLKSGVDGIAYKLDGYEEIKKTIKGALDSVSYFPPKILKVIQANAKRWDSIGSVRFTSRELDILKALARGAITKEIAHELKMSEATAETYRLRLIKKVGAPNTAALLAYAYRNGIL